MKKLPIIALLALGACSVVDDTEVCFEKHWGEYKSEVLTTGFMTYNPFSTDLICIDSRVRQYSIDKMEAFTKDKQSVFVDYTVNWRVIRETAMTMHKELGDAYEYKVSQEITNAINIIMQQNNLDTILNEQSDIQRQILDLANSRLKQYYSIVESLVIDSDPTPDYKFAVAEKQIAKEKALAEANRTEQAKQIAAQVVINAKAEAESMRIKTTALAQSKSLVDYERVQVEKIQAERWNGQLPQNIYGSAPLPILNLTK